MSDTYTIPCECSNCDHKGELKLPKGQSCAGQHECPNCGCKTASKRQKPAITVNPWPTTAPRLPEPWEYLPSHPRDITAPYIWTSGPMIPIDTTPRVTLSTTTDMPMESYANCAPLRRPNRCRPLADKTGV